MNSRVALCVGALFVWFLPIAVLAQVIAGPEGGSYMVEGSPDQITTVSNDDGTVVQYQYDATGADSGMSISVSSFLALSVQYRLNPDGTGWVQAGALPPMFITNDVNGHTQSAVLYPGLYYVDGEWSLDVDAPDPIDAATFSYGVSGQLSSMALSSGLSVQLTPPDAVGVVATSLIRPDGTVAVSALPVGGANDVTVLPAQLDAIAARFGLGSAWAETMTFKLSASGHLTTGKNANGVVMLYLVDAGPFRVGYDANGTALFYDFTPQYDDGGSEAAARVAGVAPSHVVITAEGAAGFYNDRPALESVYSAWTEPGASGAMETRYATLEPTPASSLRVGTTSRFRVQSDMYKRITTRICAGGQCWDRVWYEWVDDPIPVGGGGNPSGGGASPASGGRSPEKTGNQVAGDPVIRVRVDRGLDAAKVKLQNPNCAALLNRLGIGGTRTLLAVMKSRHYEDPYTYLTQHLTFVLGSTKDCAGNPEASTVPLSSRVAICSAFKNAGDGPAANYLIHEMMHTLGYGEAPGYPGFPTSAQINDAVRTACGN